MKRFLPTPLAALFLLSGCASDSPTDPGNTASGAAAVASVEIPPGAVTMSIGDTRTFTATAKSSSGSTLNGKTFTWSSSNAGVVSLSTSSGRFGFATALSAGNASLSATTEGVTGTVEVEVPEDEVNQLAYYYAVQDVLARPHVQVSDSIASLAHSPDAQFLAYATYGGSDVSISLLATAWQGYKTLSGHTAQVTAMTFSPNSALLATTSEDGSVRIWDVLNLEEVGSVQTPGTRALAFSPDGSRLAGAGQSDASPSVVVWGVSPFVEQRTITGIYRVVAFNTDDVLTAVSFTPNWYRLVTGSTTGVIRLYENQGSGA